MPHPDFLLVVWWHLLPVQNRFRLSNENCIWPLQKCPNIWEKLFYPKVRIQLLSVICQQNPYPEPLPSRLIRDLQPAESIKWLDALVTSQTWNDVIIRFLDHCVLLVIHGYSLPFWSSLRFFIDDLSIPVARGVSEIETTSSTDVTL